MLTVEKRQAVLSLLFGDAVDQVSCKYRQHAEHAVQDQCEAYDAGEGDPFSAEPVEYIAADTKYSPYRSKEQKQASDPHSRAPYAYVVFQVCEEDGSEDTYEDQCCTAHSAGRMDATILSKSGK